MPKLTLLDVVVVVVIIGWMFLLSKNIDFSTDKTIRAALLQQNPNCIFLEQSKISKGVYYMVCDGTILVVPNKPQEVIEKPVDKPIVVDKPEEVPGP